MAYTLKITLDGSSKPIIWRRVKVNSNLTFKTLHYVIQSLFLWENSHLYQFYKSSRNEQRLFIKTVEDLEMGKEMGYVPDDEDDNFDPNDPLSVLMHSRKDIYKEAETTLLSDVLKKEKDYIIYEYDFGDSWEHKVVLEAIDEETLLYPVCLKGKGCPPPENCGGIWGYYEMLEVLETKKPKADYNNYKQWLTEIGYELPWDRDAFDIERINEDLISDAQNNYEFYNWQLK